MSYQLLLFDFHGRIGRKWFWIATLVLIAVLVAWTVVFAVVAKLFPQGVGGFAGPVFVISHVVIVILLSVASLAVQVKRWHDRDKSGWWVLVNIVPVVGPLWAFIENGFLKGTEGRNRFGPDPLVDPVAALDGA